MVRRCGLKSESHPMRFLSGIEEEKDEDVEMFDELDDNFNMTRVSSSDDRTIEQVQVDVEHIWAVKLQSKF